MDTGFITRGYLEARLKEALIGEKRPEDDSRIAAMFLWEI